MGEEEPLTGSTNGGGSSSGFSKLQTINDNGLVLTGVNLDEARWLLYISHFFNQFSEQAWQFCLALFLAAFTNNESLILVTSYGLVTYSFVCLFGSSVGRYIDGSNRLTVARQFIGFENLAVVTATFLCYILLSRDADAQNVTSGDGDNSDPAAVTEAAPLYDQKSIILLIAIHFLGAVAMCLDSGFLVAVERDWIVVMSIGACNLQKSERVLSKEEENIQKSWLSDTNVKMRQIDLSCKILAPAIAGVFIALFDDGTSKNHGYNLRGAALLVGGVNVAALIVEYICTARIYHEIPDLALNSVAADMATIQEDEEDDSKGGGKETDKLGTTKNGKRSMKILDGLEVYFSQSICWAGFSLALLYLNVALTFGNIMTVYLVWRGISMEAIGLWRGVASAMGLAGTFIYHFMAKKIGLVEIGMTRVTFQFLCLTACYGSLFVTNTNVFFVMLIAGVCFSRIGLWVFDISVTQLMQLHVPAPVRGLVGGVQASLNAFFTVIIYVVGLFISDSKNFYIYASVSFGGVVLAAIFFGIMVFARRSMFNQNNIF